MTKEEKIKMEEAVVEALRSIFDPEIPINIHELGLIYEITVSNDADVKILMSLTAPNCPVAESLPIEVKEKVSAVEDVHSVEVEVTFEPAWDMNRMSDAAKAELDMLFS